MHVRQPDALDILGVCLVLLDQHPDLLEGVVEDKGAHEVVLHKALLAHERRVVPVYVCTRVCPYMCIVHVSYTCMRLTRERRVVSVYGCTRVHPSMYIIYASYTCMHLTRERRGVRDQRLQVQGLGFRE